MPGQAILALEVSFSTPPLGRYAGLLGVPDGDAANELTQRDGAVATRVAPFVESWRITDAASPEAGKATVTVTRTIGEDTGDIRLSLVETPAGWRVHDVGTDDAPSWSAHLEEGLAAEQ